MKERPILFTPENAQKVFEGVKTQTRRLNGLDRVNETPNDWTVLPHSDDSPLWEFIHGNTPKRTSRSWSIKCPYGVVGDQAWIREVCWIWGTWVCEGTRWKFHEHYSRQVSFGIVDGALVGKRGDIEPKWVRRPAIFMPRWACRTVVELPDIRVERLQEITGQDCLAEGVRRRSGVNDGVPLNGPGSWALNPWVWVLTFKRVQS